MASTIHLDPAASRYVKQKVAAGEAASADATVSKLVEEKRAQDLAYDHWFRSKVLTGVADADAGDFASDNEVNETLHRWR